MFLTEHNYLPIRFFQFISKRFLFRLSELLECNPSPRGKPTQSPFWSCLRVYKVSKIHAEGTYGKNWIGCVAFFLLRFCMKNCLKTLLLLVVISWGLCRTREEFFSVKWSRWILLGMTVSSILLVVNETSENKLCINIKWKKTITEIRRQSILRSISCKKFVIKNYYWHLFRLDHLGMLVINKAIF